MAMIALGALVGWAVYPLGWLWLAVPGFVLGVLVIPSILFAHQRYRKWAYVGDHYMPDCSCGSGEYFYEKVGEEFHLLCQGCKTRYEKRLDEVSVFENGEKRPYKKLEKHRGWV
jgi:hypothetical protein